MTYRDFVWNVNHGNDVPPVADVDRPHLAKMCLEWAGDADLDARKFGSPLKEYRAECATRLRIKAAELQKTF